MYTDNIAREYSYRTSAPTWSNQYIWPVLERVISKLQLVDKRAFDIGCGNGATANFLSEHGFKVTGVDPSKSGISIAKKAFPHLNLVEGSAYDDLAAIYGRFPLVVSFEVIEHCFEPRILIKTFADLLTKDGIGIISTPYHGYFKNLALAISGKLDAHFTALWDGGHIKFFSEKTLNALLQESGFHKTTLLRVGRIPMFAKSMIAIVKK